jgi:chaperonin GroEL (HSP60 family)
MEIAKTLREYSETVGGREQLAINAFANTVDIIPKTLAESAGMDSIDVLTQLRTDHENGKSKNGLDVVSGKISNMEELGILESLKIKTQALKSATEAAEMILRIDDVISAGKINKQPEPQNPYAGMGGGMGMM